MADYAFRGMAELIRDLQQLPDKLRDEGGEIVDESADTMADAVRSEYASVRVTGNLAEHVVVDRGDPAGGVMRARVRATAKHAEMYERGTIQRFTGETGANRGTMPAHPTFIPAAIRHRSAMVNKLVQMVRRVRISGMTGSLDVRKT